MIVVKDHLIIHQINNLSYFFSGTHRSRLMGWSGLVGTVLFLGPDGFCLEAKLLDLL